MFGMQGDANKAGKDHPESGDLSDDTLHDWLAGSPVRQPGGRPTVGHQISQSSGADGSGEAGTWLISPEGDRFVTKGQSIAVKIAGLFGTALGLATRCAIILGCAGAAFWFALFTWRGMLRLIG